MKKIKSEELISRLQHDITKLIAAAEHLQQADSVKLSYPPAEGKWSATQAIEHLNMYSRFYLPAIEKELVHISNDANAWFVPGFFGNYFTKMMMPGNVYEIKNKMKGMKSYRPGRGVNAEKVFKEFIEHQQKLMQLLETARKRNLEKIRIPMTISRFIQFKLGDTFRFLVAHEQRHMIQARNAIKATGVSTDKFPVILEAAQL